MKKILIFIIFFQSFILNAQKKDSSIVLLYKICPETSGIYYVTKSQEDRTLKKLNNELSPQFLYFYYSNFTKDTPDSIFFNRQNESLRYKVCNITIDNNSVVYQTMNKRDKGFIELSENNFVRGIYKRKGIQYFWEGYIQ